MSCTHRANTSTVTAGTCLGTDRIEIGVTHLVQRRVERRLDIQEVDGHPVGIQLGGRHRHLDAVIVGVRLALGAVVARHDVGRPDHPYDADLVAFAHE